VLDITEADPDGQYRVKVQIPVITGGTVGLWARVATLAAGNARGVYFRPETGDEVVLGFLNDDPRDAVIIGFLHNKDNNPWSVAQTEKTFGIITKEGMKLLFDDTKKMVTITAKTSSGEKTIVMNESGALEIKDENQNSIKMEAAGITISAGGGSKPLTLKGNPIKLN
jgi:uncharacterized protein involved in type VI secretion and phage assembly